MKSQKIKVIIYVKIIDGVGWITTMFQVNDVIVYGTQGVCKITGTEEKRLVGRK